MKIITWNVNGIRAWAKKGMWQFVEREQPEIFCVQETKALPEQVPLEIHSPSGFNAYWCSAQRKGYSGVATFSKIKPKNNFCGIGVQKFDDEGRVVGLDFDGFTLLNIYFPNGGASQERHFFKQEFLKDLKAYVKERLSAQRQFIIVGDYNVAPESIDVYDPVALANESGFLAEERKWFREFLELGFVDSYRHFYPNEKDVYTWWSMIERGRLGNRGWRIDHICVSKGLVGKVKSVKVYQDELGSDHCPVGIDLEV